MTKYIPSWEGHRTTELDSKYPIQIITPYPRYSFHTMYDGKGSWMNEVPEHKVKAADGHCVTWYSSRLEILRYLRAYRGTRRVSGQWRMHQSADTPPLHL